MEGQGVSDRNVYQGRQTPHTICDSAIINFTKEPDCSIPNQTDAAFRTVSNVLGRIRALRHHSVETQGDGDVTSFRTELRDVNSAHNPSKAVSGNLRARAVHRTKITRCVAASVTSCPAVVRFSRVLLVLSLSAILEGAAASNNIERLGRQCESSTPILGPCLSFVSPSLLTKPNNNSQGTNALRARHRCRAVGRSRQADEARVSPFGTTARLVHERLSA
jgi:hypothetical protein